MVGRIGGFWDAWATLSLVDREKYARVRGHDSPEFQVVRMYDWRSDADPAPSPAPNRSIRPAHISGF